VPSAHITFLDYADAESTELRNLGFLQIENRLAVHLGVFYFGTGAGADVAIYVDYVDSVGHIDFALVHIVQHLLRSLRPDLIVSAVAKETYADYNVPGKRQPLLRLQELILETCATTEGDDWVTSYHLLFFIQFTAHPKLYIEVDDKVYFLIGEPVVRCNGFIDYIN